MSALALGRRERLRFAAVALAATGETVVWPVVAAVANRHWYAGLLRPFFAPGPWLAGLLLVAVAGAAGWALFRMLCSPDYHPDRTPAIRAALIAGGLASAWVWAFFVGRHPTLSLAFAVALCLVSVFAVWRAAALERRAALLMVPWTFAALFVALVDISVRIRNG